MKPAGLHNTYSKSLGDRTTCQVTGPLKERFGRHVLRLRPLPPYLHALRRQARRVFTLARQRGEIVAPTRCDRCHQKPPTRIGETWTALDAHHPDYSKPLDVQWLCHWCHLIADTELRNTLRRLAFGHPALDRVFTRVPYTKLPIRGEVAS